MKRVAILIEKSLTAGKAANISALLMGQASLLNPEVYDDTPVADADGQNHAAIRYSTIVLEAGMGQLISMPRTVKREQPDVSCIVFSRTGQGLHNAFETYKECISSSTTEATQPVGLILVGEDTKIRALTKKFSILK
jgi:hypothetical protein